MKKCLPCKQVYIIFFKRRIQIGASMVSTSFPIKHGFTGIKLYK